MVTHTQNLCSAFNPSKVHTHSSEHTHTPWAHTRSSGQPFMPRRPGSSWGFSALLKGTSVVVLRVEIVLDIHSPHLQFLPARDSNSQPFDYESDSLTIRPRLPPQIFIRAMHSGLCTDLSDAYLDPSCGNMQMWNLDYKVKSSQVKSSQVFFIVSSSTCTVHTYRELKLRYSQTLGAYS